MKDQNISHEIEPTTKLGELPFDGLYVLRSVINTHLIYSGATEILHVMSKHFGGECRSYYRAHNSRTPFSLRPNVKPIDWPELDEAVFCLVKEKGLI
jgi:hypothetical protein